MRLCYYTKTGRNFRNNLIHTGRRAGAERAVGEAAGVERLTFVTRVRRTKFPTIRSAKRRVEVERGESERERESFSTSTSTYLNPQSGAARSGGARWVGTMKSAGREW